MAPPTSPAPKATPLLDHVVILVPHAFLASPPAWLRAPFRFAPGGRHADGRTENALVLLADGSYLEFIAFVPAASAGGGSSRHEHRWGRKAEGTVIDWALTLHAPGDDDGSGDEIRHGAEFRDIQDRVGKAAADAGFAYGDPVRGGRLRPDGAELRWAVASARRRREGKGEGHTDAAASASTPGPEPDGASWAPVEPGQLPFWCLDETPRRLRVPFEEDGGDKTRHPTGIVGVAEVEVVVAGGGGGDGDGLGKEKEALAAAYDAVFGEKGGRDGWEVETVAGGRKAGRLLHPPGRIVLSAARAQEGGGSGDGAGAGAGGSIKITFYTDDENWVGKTIGGKVDGEHTLEFKLVAATPK
ncbi:hypothetical protein SLS62_006899 [Diatrype stigma]|uniref:Glyoxalase-like domain-containing protein n=1 Tax=Diatrype stigma TaxID=117547 RepID=A0AAN9UP57_9PEZI